MVVNAVDLAVASAVSALLADAGVVAHNIDEIVYEGGTTCLPGRDDCQCICFSGRFRGNLKIETPFSRGTVVGGIGDPTTIFISHLSAIMRLSYRKAFSRETIMMNEVKATTPIP